MSDAPRQLISYIAPAAPATRRPAEIRADLDRVAREYGPCDVVCADVEPGTPDERVRGVIDLCEELSHRYGTVD